LKPILQKYIVDKETKEGNVITPTTIISFDSTKMSSLLYDKNYMNQMLHTMLAKAPTGYDVYGYDVFAVASKSDYSNECKAKFFVLYE
jgi:hypothetical protein